MSAKIDSSTLDFLQELATNNNRDWFAQNKDRYIRAQGNIKTFMSELFDMMNKHDVIESFKSFRIYRDVRFSKDKSPYKSNLGTSFTRATEARRGGCYINIEPGNNFVAGGFWGPNSTDLKRIRKEIEYDAAPFRKIINTATFKKNFGQLEGEQLKTAPKGFSTDHPDIDLLRFKQYLIIRRFNDEVVLSTNFMEECDKTFQAMRPFFDYMSQTLTTDENGESIL